MTYSKTQYEEMARKFNLLGLTGKLLLIKNHSDVFYLEIDGDNFFLRLHQRFFHIPLPSESFPLRNNPYLALGLKKKTH